MNLVNLTPHEVILVGIKIPASGSQARVATTRQQTGTIDLDGTTVPIYRTVLGQVTGLPEAAEGVGYIVSAMVRSAAPERRDLYSPADLVRDSSGNVIGCGSLDANQASAEARWRQAEVARLTAIIQAAAMKASRLADLQRDEHGNVIGCGSLDANQ